MKSSLEIAASKINELQQKVTNVNEQLDQQRDRRLKDVAKILKLANNTLGRDDVAADLRDRTIDLIEYVLMNNNVYYGYTKLTETDTRREYAVHPHLKPYM